MKDVQALKIAWFAVMVTLNAYNFMTHKNKFFKYFGLFAIIWFSVCIYAEIKLI